MPNETNSKEYIFSPTIFPQRSTIISLNIGLYPWASDEYLKHYRQVIEHYWYESLGNRHVHLNWLRETDWDGGYHKIPQNHFDLFVYDTMFTNYYISQGWLCQLNSRDITHYDEIHSNLLSSISYNGNYYGIPIYGCIYVLFYRSTDQEMASVKNFDQLIQLAKKRDFVMRKPSRTLKTLTYLKLLDDDQRFHQVTEKNLNRCLINRLCTFYRHSKYLLDKTDRYSFDHSSFYIGFTEDLNTILVVNDEDLSQIDLMFVPTNSEDQTHCWLDCIGIHAQTKSRQTYEKSLELANLMSCSTVMNECLEGQFYVIPTNRVTLTHLARKNNIYAKLETLIQSSLFCPSSSLPAFIDSSISIEDQWTTTMATVITQHEKHFQPITVENEIRTIE